MNVNKQRLFGVAKEIDDTVSRVKKKAIVLVGLTRVGKSTSYNWILRHPLVTKKEGGKICYTPQVIRTGTAEVKSGFKSCTMVPNIVELDKEIDLCDMAGFGENRDYVGTLAVSYSLKALFEAVDQIKFVVVISESYFTDGDGQKLCNALNHFLQLFNFDVLPGLREELFKATALLVTQSKNATKHLEYIDSTIENLDDFQLQNIYNREEIRSLLQHIRKQNRVGEFAAAKMDTPPKECKVFQHFHTKDWEYLSLKQLQEADAIRLPFREQFKKMREVHRNTFDRVIDQREKSYKEFSAIFIRIFQGILQEGTIHDIRLPYNFFFQQVEAFIFKNDHYDTDKEISQQQLISARFNRPQKEMLLKLIMEFMRVVKEFDVESIDFIRREPLKLSMVLRETINQMIELIIAIFCRQQAELKLVLRMKLILLRGVREFYMLEQVDKKKVVASLTSITDGFQSMLNRGFEDILLKFVSCFDLRASQRVAFGEKKSGNVLQNYFSSRENAYAFEILFILHEDKWTRFASESKDAYYQLMRDTKLIHAKYEHEKGSYRESSEYLLQAYSLQLKYEQSCLKRIRYDLDLTLYKHSVEEMHLNQENILDMLRQNLLKMDRVQQALALAKHMGWVHSACQAYQLRLKKELSKKDLSELVQEYAEYCLQHGRRERGVELLQQLQEIDRSTFQRRKQINKNLSQSIYNWQTLQEKYKKFLQKQETIDLFDPTRQDIITSIKKALRDMAQVKTIIKLCRSRVCQSASMLTEEDSKLILKKYLQERLGNEAVVAQNGFTVQYVSGEAASHKLDEKQERLCDNLKVGNIVELQQLTPRLLVMLEKESKGIASQKGRVITIDLQKVTRHDQEVSQKHMIVKLSSQSMRPTFEYASRTTKRLKGIVYEPFQRIKELIDNSAKILQDLATEIQGYLLRKYYSNPQDVKNREEVRKLIQLIHQDPDGNSDTLAGRFISLCPQSKLVRGELLQMVEYIREKARQELSPDVIENMGGVNDSLANSSYQQ